MLNRENILLFLGLGLMVILTIWLQFILLEKPADAPNNSVNKRPDYYIENFTSYGVDAENKQYELEADRLVHYPLDNKSLLDRPHLTQIIDSENPTHIYADSGWLFADGSEILLTENVRVIRSQGGLPGGGAKTNRMRIKLKPKNAE